MKRLFLTSALVTMLCASAFADDKEILTSKYYTDANYASLSNFNSLSTTVSGKQNKIPATTSTYVYNSTNNASADGSVVTTNTLGATGERGIAKAVVSNGSGGYTNDNWLPTVGAMMAAINAHTPTALTWTSTETTAAGNYSTTFDGGTGNWPTADADKLIDVTGLATALSNKQNKIGATSDGTNNSPNYVYNATTNPTAAGSVVTTTTTPGTLGERGIASKLDYTTTNDVLTVTNGDWIPTVGATATAVANAGVHFYGVSTAAATAETRDVTIDGISELVPGLMVIVKPTITAAYANNTNAAKAKLRLNNLDAKVMRCNGATLTTTTDGLVWKAATPGLWIYDGTYWNFAGYNTMYSVMSVADGRAGTESSNRTMAATNLKSIIHGISLTDADVSPITFTPSNAPIDASTDTLMSALGKLQGQINYKQNQIGATSDGTNNSPNYVYNQSTNPSADGSVVTTGATDGATGQRGIANQAVYTTENNVTTLSNGHWVANVEFVETKQDKKVCAGYEPGHNNDPDYCWLWVLPN